MLFFSQNDVIHFRLKWIENISRKNVLTTCGTLKLESIERHASRNSERRASNPYRCTSNPEKRASNPEKRASNLEKHASNPERHASSLGRRASNLERWASNCERRTSNPERRASSLGRCTSNPERCASNLERHTSNPERHASNPYRHFHPVRCASNLERRASNPKGALSGSFYLSQFYLFFFSSSFEDYFGSLQYLSSSLFYSFAFQQWFFFLLLFSLIICYFTIVIITLWFFIITFVLRSYPYYPTFKPCVFFLLFILFFRGTSNFQSFSRYMILHPAITSMLFTFPVSLSYSSIQNWWQEIIIPFSPKHVRTRTALATKRMHNFAGSVFVHLLQEHFSFQSQPYKNSHKYS